MNKFNFLLELLGGAGSKISSKRSVMVFFVTLFAFLIIVNTFTGKTPSDEFRGELFQLTVLSIVLVFGEFAYRVYQAIKGNKSELPPPDPSKTSTDPVK